MSLRNKTSVKSNKKFLHEDGNIIIWVVLIFPILFASFGVSVDASLASYTRANLQSAADAATLGVMTHANNPNVYDNTCGGGSGTGVGTSSCHITPYINPNAASSNAGVPAANQAIYDGAVSQFNQLYGNDRQNISPHSSTGNFSPLLICQDGIQGTNGGLPPDYLSYRKVIQKVIIADGSDIKSASNIPYESVFVFGAGIGTNYGGSGSNWSFINGGTDPIALSTLLNSASDPTAEYLDPNSLATAFSLNEAPGDTCKWTQVFGTIFNTVNSTNYSVTLVEESNPIFLGIVGIPYLTYYVNSSARSVFH